MALIGPWSTEFGARGKGQCVDVQVLPVVEEVCDTAQRALDEHVLPTTHQHLCPDPPFNIDNIGNILQGCQFLGIDLFLIPNVLHLLILTI